MARRPSLRRVAAEPGGIGEWYCGEGLRDRGTGHRGEAEWSAH